MSKVNIYYRTRLFCQEKIAKKMNIYYCMHFFNLLIVTFLTRLNHSPRHNSLFCDNCRQKDCFYTFDVVVSHFMCNFAAKIIKIS